MMERDWKRRFTWIDLSEVDQAFLKEPFPPRGHRGDLGPLRASISRCGIINPIIARVQSGKLQVICGYRRWLAAQVAGIERLPVLITSLSDEEAGKLYLEEAGGWNVDPMPKTVEFERPAPPFPVVGRRAGAGEMGAKGEGAELLYPSKIGKEKIYRRLRDLTGQCREIFEEVRCRRMIPVNEVESTIQDLLALAPQRRSLDIREIDGLGDSSSRIAAGKGGKAYDWVAAHSVRVAVLACQFANRLAWPEAAVAQLALSGLLHDAGMLFIPVDWFSSPLPLTGSRYEALKAHTLIGREIIDQAKRWPPAIALVAQDHHERWDGTGYPAGRKGREVALPARIVGLLDSYAAMVSKRSYRPPYLLSEALQTIHESAQIGLFEPALERQFRSIFTTRPVGMRCRLPDGSLIQVQEVQPKRAKSHLLIVEEGGSQFRRGEEIWYREKELLAQTVEVKV
ncbi:MAG: HD domain-containing protein [Planctomycetes bacterium]|nr:HD domain-containing protein [Planctomycetota bacterium]